MKSSQHLARLGEKLAEKFLTQKGFTPVKKNYRIRGGEIDLIMENEEIVLFVEVKTRRSTRFGLPHEDVSPNQKRAFIRTIFHYLKRHPTKKRWRVDLVNVRLTQKQQALITHILHIFLK